ncbi:cell division protein DedD [Erwiniaceae bacterium BAC15a-03b]|uniref:Cell division protein DedD n=1 Tax=Winslowiella arboricola TaxID=2978220 RepID=A0A9J6PKW0_9GAMM|nr:cell division protein DedD [Winslowiella arboricola]MCU5772795.1 cell division protein DedD [Winslowiella arboricola]MCU5777099.1 cell division protein DedD [Winslowiella arboricola]
MASKFQNRLVGTVILVAVGVIVLPGLLDGKKKHYKEEFAAIPLVPKPDDQQDTDMVPPVSQSLPAQPPEGAGDAVGGDSDEVSQPADNGATMPQSHSQPTVVSPPPMQPSQPQAQPKPQPQPKPVTPPKPKPVEQPKPQPQPKPVEQPKPEAKPETKPQEQAPGGQAYVVQLGALKNASKVNEIVAQLRLSGYRAYTVPSTPVQGQITRIYVGPDASKTKMQAAVGELQSISGLGGVVKPYSAR